MDRDGEGKSWVEAELEDSFDEELEMEIDDSRVAAELRSITTFQHKSRIERRFYFHELFRLQAELVRLQDWVAHSRYKLVVLFEGRDSAGKGGVIKRISQRLNPRSAASSPCPPPPSASRRNGTSSATCPICLPVARSCSSTAPGTTVPGSSG